MSVVSWGAPKLHFAKIAAGDAIEPTITPAQLQSKYSSTYFVIDGDYLLQDSSTLNTTEGEEKTLMNERGVIVDKKKLPASYTFTTSVIKKKADSVVTPKIKDVMKPKNGVVDGEWVMILEGEDAATVGFIFRKASITISKSWSGAQGALDVLNVNGLEPNTDEGVTDGDICVDYSLSD